MDCVPSSIGLRRMALKDLEPDLDNILIVAIIIGKQTPRKFPDKNKEDEHRAVWNLTLRDSQRDYINVSYWGPSEEVCTTNDRFYTGDVVEIRNPRINIRKFNEASEQYCPTVTSPFSLTLSEQSQILPYNGDILKFTQLLNFPTKPLSGYVPLRDIQTGGETMKDRIIDILGAVRKVGPIKNITTKNGKEMEMREVLLFDHTSSGLRLFLWDAEIIARATKWKPRDTILFITDTKIKWSDFSRCYNASVTSRSIITENPVGAEAKNLANYAKTAPLESSDILEQIILDLPDPETIQNVMNVQQVHNKMLNLSQNNYSMEPQLTALMFVAVTQLDLDGPLPVTRAKCASCKSFVRSTSPRCENSECMVAAGVADPVLNHSFEISVNLSDHTGTLSDCRLSGSSAEQVLGCTVQQFLRMFNEQKCHLKWKFLLERCAVRIVVLISNRMIPRVSILSCSTASPKEASQRIPMPFK